jgi:U3 small nucleolar RNA-associated protein 20
VWRSLSNRIIPKVESFLMKEKVDKHGSKNKSLRSSVVLALMKLYQKLPTSIFESKLPKLITCVCNALKNKDSNDRESASDTLSKMAVSLDMKYLPLILSELSISLSEGYMRGSPPFHCLTVVFLLCSILFIKVSQSYRTISQKLFPFFVSLSPL